MEIKPLWKQSCEFYVGGRFEMTKYFNTEGSCKPKEHYMVKLDDRLEMIKNLLVDRKNISSSTADASMERPRH